MIEGDIISAKVFRTIDEQLEILKEKGLYISDEDEAKDILLRENYFFVNAYRLVFLKSDGSRKFVENSTFDELYSLFSFDRKLRNIIFKNILIIENNYKSMFSYVMSRNYGYKERDYLNPLNFNNSKEKIRQINDLLRKVKRQIRINAPQNRATSHYVNNYGYIPLWVSAKVLSFGIISEMYGILKDRDREEIADMYNISDNELETYLTILSNYRNLCAHEDMLFGNRTQKMIPDSKYHNLLNVGKDSEGIYKNGKCDIFSIVIIFKSLLRKDDFKMFMNEINYEIDELSGKIKSIDMKPIYDKLGFPENYREIMYIE